MHTLQLTILKEDILENNYKCSDNCPITKALRRAGSKWTDVGGIADENGRRIMSSSCNDNYNESYKELLTKLFSMYNSEEFQNTLESASDKTYFIQQIEVPPAPVLESFTHTLTWSAKDAMMYELNNLLN